MNRIIDWLIYSFIHNVGLRHGMPTSNCVDEMASQLLLFGTMGHHRLFYEDSKLIRTRLNETRALAENIHQQEQILIRKLYEIDQNVFMFVMDSILSVDFANGCSFLKHKLNGSLLR
jgi:hypothetical protein